MKKCQEFISGFFTVFLYLFVPQFVFAALPPIITFQPSPKTYIAGDSTTYYAYNEDVIYSGNWALPPDYFAKIKYIRDGIFLASTTINTFGSSPTTGPFLWNARSTITSTWNAPSMDQTPGLHDTQLQIVADARCILGPYIDTFGNSIPQCLRCVSAGNPVGCKWQTVQTTNLRKYNITPAPLPVLDVTPMILPAFSATEGGSYDQTFTVKNIGGAVMNGTISITGGSGTFTCFSGCSYTVNPGLTAPPVIIRFSPPLGSGDGSGDDPDYTATVKFICTPGCTIPFETRAVSGNSIADIPPAIGLYEGGTSTLLPSPLDFGTVSLGSLKDISVRVKNIGGSDGGDLAGKITIPSGQYSCVANTCASGCNYSSLGGGQTCDITVRFQPTIAGTDNPTATFSNTPLEPPPGAGKVLHLFTGFGNNKSILEVTALPPIDASCTPTTKNPASCNITTGGTFVNVGDIKIMSFEIRNVGVNMMGGAFSISPSADFDCLGPCPVTYANLVPGDPPFMVYARFKPVAGGPCDGSFGACKVTLNFTNKLNNNSGAVQGPPVSFDLWANGNNSPVYGVVPKLNFGTVLVGDTETISDVLHIVNSGVGIMKIKISTPVGSFTCTVPADCTSFTIAGGGFQDVAYEFSPTSAGFDSADINVRAKDTGGAVIADVDYTLTGTGILPLMTVTPTSSLASPIDYGVVNVGDTSAVKVYTLKNTGVTNKGVLGNNKIQYTVTNPGGHFNCVLGCSGTLPQGASATVHIEFVPGTDTGQIDETVLFKYKSVPLPALVGSVTGYVTGYGNDAPWLSVVPVSGTNYGTIDVQAPLASPSNKKDYNFTIKNTGVGPLPLTGSATGFGGSFTCVAGCGAYSLNAGEQVTMTIRFKPITDGYKTKDITFINSGDTTKNIILTLSGIGNLVRSASIAPTGSYNFGTMNIGDPPPVKTIILTNTGLGNWKGEVSVELPFKCAPADGFGRCVYNVPPLGGTTPIDIIFDPTVETSYVSRVGFSGRTNPLAYYPFDREDNLGGGTIRDASGNKLDGTLMNGAVLTPVGGGKFNEALSLDGVNDYADLTNNTAFNMPTGQVSISAWIKKTVAGQNGAIISKWTTFPGPNNSYLLYVGQDVSNQKSGFSIQQSNDAGRGVNGTSDIPANVWAHVVGVADGTDIHIYVNGILEKSAPYDGTLDVSTKKVLIGKLTELGVPNYTFEGLVDEVKIFDRAITPAQIAELVLESEHSKTFDQSLLVKLRALVGDTAEASHFSPPPADKISLVLNGDATFTPLINLDLGTFDFGKVVVNKFKDQTFQFTNTGVGTLGPGTLSVAAPFYCLQTENDVGTITPTCDYNVAAGSFFKAKIRFRPTAKGIFAQDLIFSTPPGLISLPLQGEGILPIVKFFQF